MRDSTRESVHELLLPSRKHESRLIPAAVREIYELCETIAVPGPVAPVAVPHGRVAVAERTDLGYKLVLYGSKSPVRSKPFISGAASSKLVSTSSSQTQKRKDSNTYEVKKAKKAKKGAKEKKSKKTK